MQNLFNMDNPVWRALGRLADLMILNLCFIVCCIPIITIGPAITALNYVTLKMAEKEEGYIAKAFFKSFRENFKQATIIGLIMLLLAIVLSLDFYIMSNATGTFATVFRIILMVIVVIYAMVFLYIFPIQCRFYNTIRMTFRNAFIMAIADFPRTIVMALITAGSVIVTLFNQYTIVYGTLVWILCGFAAVSYANMFFMKNVFAKYMPKSEEDEMDPDNWTLDEEDGSETPSDAPKELESGSADAHQAEQDESVQTDIPLAEQDESSQSDIPDTEA